MLKTSLKASLRLPYKVFHRKEQMRRVFKGFLSLFKAVLGIPILF